MTRKRKRVALPRPRGTRATSRVELLVSMHPRRMAQLVERAAAASMSLTAYVDALLASDGDDVAPRPRSTLSLAELAGPPALLGARVNRDVEVRDLDAARSVAAALGAPLADDECECGAVVPPEQHAAGCVHETAEQRAARLSDALDEALARVDVDAVASAAAELTPNGAEALAKLGDALGAARVDVEQLAGRAKRAKRPAARAAKKGGR